MSAIRSKTRYSIVSPEELSRTWRVGINRARETLKATTQRGVRTAVHPVTRKSHRSLLAEVSAAEHSVLLGHSLCDNQVAKRQQVCPSLHGKRLHTAPPDGIKTRMRSGATSLHRGRWHTLRLMHRWYSQADRPEVRVAQVMLRASSEN